MSDFINVSIWASFVFRPVIHNFVLCLYAAAQTYWDFFESIQAILVGSEFALSEAILPSCDVPLCNIIPYVLTELDISDDSVLNSSLLRHRCYTGFRLNLN